MCISVNLELIHDLWVPNIYIYNLKSFKVIDVLSKLAGLWINNKKEVYYSQATHITFICPMLFDSFPLDTQVCKFQVSSHFPISIRAYFWSKSLIRLLLIGDWIWCGLPRSSKSNSLLGRLNRLLLLGDLGREAPYQLSNRRLRSEIQA